MASPSDLPWREDDEILEELASTDIELDEAEIAPEPPRADDPDPME